MNSNELHQSKMKTKILIVDDEAPIRQILSESLKDDGYEVLTAPDGPTGLQVLKEFQPHICFLDIWMPKMDGLEVLAQGVPAFPETSFVMISGHGTIDTAVKATKTGAWDFIEKPLSLDKVSLVIENLLKFKSEKDEKIALLNKLRKSIGLVGESKILQNVREKISFVAKNSDPVLVTGEIGTGRELVCQNIHYMSHRASRTFSDINCQLLPQELIEIELFGIEKGALPGIDKLRRGKLELLEGGTLMIKEIEEMPEVLQEKLGQFFKTKSFKRVGSSQDLKSDVRILMTSFKSIEELEADPKMSKELVASIKQQFISITPLRDRPEDILPLMVHFSDMTAKQLASFRKTISEQGLKLLVKHNWPGNVRELKNFIERVYILTPSDYVDVHDLRFAGMNDRKETAQVDLSTDLATFREARAEFEKNYLVKKIQENGGNISKTAESIGLERSYLHRKIKAYGIEVNL